MALTAKMSLTRSSVRRYAYTASRVASGASCRRSILIRMRAMLGFALMAAPTSTPIPGGRHHSKLRLTGN